MDAVERVREMGVVGAGGGGFPTHVKIARPCQVVIANGAECEPLLFHDKWTMEEESEAVIEGLRLVMAATRAREGIIALKGKGSLGEESLLQVMKNKKNMRIVNLGDYYPAGDEFLLVQEITGKIIPEGAIPLSVGVVVLNVETLKNISRAVQGQPVIYRTLTCHGEVERPAVLRVRVGTPFQEVLNACGGVTVPDYAIVVGGPMMGSVVTDPLMPVTKTTSGLLVLPRDHVLVRKKTLPLPFIVKQSKAACCQCTYCTELCPRYLLGHDLAPHKIMRQINLGLDVPPQVVENAFLCSECGLCEVYACPMELSPRVINREIKARFMAVNYRPTFPSRDVHIRESLPYRKIPVTVLKHRLQLYQYEKRELERGKDVGASTVELLMKQHAGAPARPVVRVGEMVQEGDVVGESSGEISARVHASIGGKVVFVNDERVVIAR